MSDLQAVCLAVPLATSEIEMAFITFCYFEFMNYECGAGGCLWFYGFSRRLQGLGRVKCEIVLLRWLAVDDVPEGMLDVIWLIYVPDNVNRVFWNSWTWPCFSQSITMHWQYSKFTMRPGSRFPAQLLLNDVPDKRQDDNYRIHTHTNAYIQTHEDTGQTELNEITNGEKK